MTCYSCHASVNVLFYRGRRGVCASCQLPDPETPAREFVPPAPPESADKLPAYSSVIPGAKRNANDGPRDPSVPAYAFEAGYTRERMMAEELGKD